MVHQNKDGRQTQITQTQPPAKANQPVKNESAPDSND